MNLVWELTIAGVTVGVGAGLLNLAFVAVPEGAQHHSCNRR